MGDTLETPVDQSTPEQIAEASKLGWAPIERWRGDAAHWVDAATFLERGKTMLPLLKANNARLEGEVGELRKANDSLKNQLGEINSNMEEFVKAQREMLKDRLAEQRKQLLAERKTARDEGDDTTLDQIEEQLEQNKEQSKKLAEPPAKKEEPKAEEAPQEPPEYKAWKASNEWFGGESEDDVMLTALAFKYGREAFNKGLRNDAYYAYIDEKMAPRLKKSPAPSKVEGGGPSGSGGGGTAKGYNALPPEAKSRCDEDEKRFVGPNKMFKTKEAWRAHFVAQYF